MTPSVWVSALVSFSHVCWDHTDSRVICDELLVWLLPLCTAAAHADVTLLWLVYLVETDSSVVQTTAQDLKDCGFDCWETSIGGPGVQQHSPLSVKEEVLEILNRYWETTCDSGWSRGWTRCSSFLSFQCSANELWVTDSHNEWSWTELPQLLITDFTDWSLWKLTREWQWRGIYFLLIRLNVQLHALSGLSTRWHQSVMNVFFFINRIHSERLW